MGLVEATWTCSSNITQPAQIPIDLQKWIGAKMVKICHLTCSLGEPDLLSPPSRLAVLLLSPAQPTSSPTLPSPVHQCMQRHCCNVFCNGHKA